MPILFHLYNNNRIIQRIKLARLQWAGHVARTRKDNQARKVFLARPYGTRRRGRPRLRWSDSVQKDAETLEMSGGENMRFYVSK